MAVRISDEQAKALGIEQHIPKRAGRRAGLDDQGRNKTEARFGAYLDTLLKYGAIRAYWFESVKLRLARTTFYTPDYFVIRSDGLPGCYEVKGFWRDDARVKIKVAAEKYPGIAFVAVRLVNREWEFETIQGRGIEYKET
jgi:hypothetical protein